MVGQPQRAKQVVEKRIPRLKTGPGITKSGALHDIKYIGPLRKWFDFGRDVCAAFDQKDWLRHIVVYSPSGPPGPHNIANEQVCVGDETGVKGGSNRISDNNEFRVRFAELRPRIGRL